ncbi:MAG: tetratricopeptide repeat protein [Sedimentisphaerales bacterium]|nr:tetratricopeptide repeat protein [Sedimentisphaerales bacterium]
MAPILFLLLLEIGLTVAGFGRPATFFVSSGKKGMLTTNHWYVWFYRPTRTTSPHPCLIQTPKPNDTIRLFVLGESAAIGTPKPAFNFGRVLELMLQDRFPRHRVEVINAAMRGIDSHIVASISAECARLQPDLFVVYMGNNEVIGQYGPTTFLGRHPGLIGVLHRMMATRVAQCLRVAVARVASGAEKAGSSETMESFRRNRVALDDSRREATYRNYRRNLTRICDHAVAAGAGVVVATIPVNLKDCPPLASLHRRDLTAEQLETWESLYNRAAQNETEQRYAEAIAGYREALAIDDHDADLHYRLARCHLALGDQEAARTHFSLARDWDALQFRTDSALNDIIREVASARADKKVHLVDAAGRLAPDSPDPNGIPGQELFNDHVHCNFDGDYRLVRLLLPAVVEALQRDRGVVAAEPSDIPTRDQCAARLAFTAWEEVDTLAAVAKMLARPPFLDQIDHAPRQAALEKRVSEMNGRIDQAFVDGAVKAYDDAIALNPSDWALHYNYANFLYQLQRYGQATPHIRYVADMFPGVPAFHVLFGYCLAGSGHLDQSIEQFRLARRLDKHSKPIKEALAWAEQRKRDLTQETRN